MNNTRDGRARRRGGSKRVFSVIFLILPPFAPTDATALVWPDVAERVQRDLSAADPAARRAAARELRSLGAARGAPLAVAALDDPDDDVRLAAADAAIRLRAAGATDKVATWLNAPEARLRREACEVARALPSVRVVSPLARTLGDPDPEVRAAAAEALGHQSSADAVPPLLGRLDDPTPTVRIQIVASLARLGDARAVVPLVGKVEDSSADVRQAVARALGALGDARASSALVLALRDQSSDVRREALAALGRMRAGDAVDAISPLMTDKTASIRFAALEALGRIATPDAVRVLVAALGAADDGSGSLERTPVRDALVAAGPAAIASLHTVLSASPSPPAATSASWVLGELHARAEAPSIVASMRRGALQTAAALHALSGAGTDAEVPVVLEFVADPSPIVRAEALRAAMALLDPNRPDGRAVEPLAAALRDSRPSPQDRARLVTLLGRTGAPRAAPLLVELTHANDLSLRISAIDALGNLGPAAQPQRAEAGGSDEALLEAIESREPVIRLRAAIALSQAGTARAREVLLARLDGGDEVDRPDVLTALGGVLARAPSDAAVTRLAATLELAAGPERDAVVEALGRAPSGSAVRALATVARSQDPADRREAAKMCAAQAADMSALAVARALLADSDPSVRADAAWSLRTIGDVSDLARLESTARSSEVDLAVDSAAAVGHIAARTRTSDGASRVLCPLVTDARAYVRANALDGLALAGIRCGDGALERTALTDDSSDDVRAAAALAVSRKPDADDSRALDRCARNDSSGAVATRCRAPAALPIRTHPTLVYVVPEGADAPRPAAAYAMLLADGSIRAGMTDRRGAVFEPVAPEGEVTLRRPSAFAR